MVQQVQVAEQAEYHQRHGEQHRVVVRQVVRFHGVEGVADQGGGSRQDEQLSTQRRPVMPEGGALVVGIGPGQPRLSIAPADDNKQRPGGRNRIKPGRRRRPHRNGPGYGAQHISAGYQHHVHQGYVLQTERVANIDQQIDAAHQRQNPERRRRCRIQPQHSPQRQADRRQPGDPNRQSP